MEGPRNTDTSLKSKVYGEVYKDVNVFLNNQHEVFGGDYANTLKKIDAFIGKVQVGISHYNQKKVNSPITNKRSQAKLELLVEKKEKLLQLKSRLYEGKSAEDAAKAAGSTKKPHTHTEVGHTNSIPGTGQPISTTTSTNTEKPVGAITKAGEIIGVAVEQLELNNTVPKNQLGELEKSAEEFRTPSAVSGNSTSTSLPTNTFLNTSGSFKLYATGDNNFGTHFLGVLEAIGRVILLPFVAIGLLFASIGKEKDTLSTSMNTYLDTIKESATLKERNITKE